MKTLLINLLADLFVDTNHPHLSFSSFLSNQTTNKSEGKEVSYFLIAIFVYELISNSSLRMLVIMMLATIALHCGQIKSNMHANNPSFLQIFLLSFLLLL